MAATLERNERNARTVHKAMLAIDDLKSAAGGEDFDKLDDKKKDMLMAFAKALDDAQNSPAVPEGPLPGDRPSTKETMEQVNTAIKPSDEKSGGTKPSAPGPNTTGVADRQRRS